ncbi:MAG TPA: glycosyltransferase family 39 protein [Vicinamibacteria bacterium]|nr:glycosyltransferase family 39 protein [Vicinamibacteria bacterium]
MDHRRARWEIAAVVGLLCVLALELTLALRADGLTIDEVVYIGSGFRHLLLSDYRPNPEQPPLAKMVGALPLLALRPHVPAITDETWSWSYQFVFVANEPGPLIVWARAPTVLLTVVLAAATWGWARYALGAAAGLAALALTVFHPSILAHGHLITTDAPGTLTMLGGSWVFWWWGRAPSLRRALLVALAVGVAVSTRLTGWLLLPIFALLLAARLRKQPAAQRRALLRQSAILAACFALVPIVVWASYDYRYEPYPGRTVAQVPGPWLGLTGRIIAALEKVRALPEAYLEGARFVAEHNALGHPTYLLGEMSTKGWPHYYLVAFLVKNTPGFLLALAAAIVLLWRARMSADAVELHWLVPALVTFLAASTGHIQIGERYILPMYPYLILLIASTLPRFLATPRGRAAAGALLLAHAVPSLLAARGGYISYFNLLAGGREGGHRVLVDSNLDWGQDLPRLARWMRDHGVDEIQLAYHGSDDPDRFHIRHEDVDGYRLHPTHPAAGPVHGTFAISPNIRLGIFEPPGKNPWAWLDQKPVDDRAGVYFIYRLP